MQITALIEVINYLKKISGDSSLVEGYKKLSELIKEASGNKEGDFSSAILLGKSQLRNLLLESDPSEWGYASYSLFEKINKNQLFGKAAADYLDNLITPENKDYKSIYSGLNRRVTQISKLSETLSQLQKLFDLVIPAELFQIDDETNNESSLFLYFEGQLLVQNISDLERYARLWDSILSAFSKLTGEENLALDINSFRKGNIVLGVATKDKTLSALMTGVTGIFDLLSVVLKIRKIQVEVELLPFQNNLTELLEEEIQTLINQKAFELAQKLVSVYPNETYISDEITSDISRSLKQILSFVVRGGKIEFKPLLSNKELIKTNKNLIESFAIARELQKVTGLLSQHLAKKTGQQNDGESEETVEVVKQTGS